MPTYHSLSEESSRQSLSKGEPKQSFPDCITSKPTLVKHSAFIQKLISSHLCEVKSLWLRWGFLRWEVVQNSKHYIKLFKRNSAVPDINTEQTPSTHSPLLFEESMILNKEKEGCQFQAGTNVQFGPLKQHFTLSFSVGSTTFLAV